MKFLKHLFRKRFVYYNFDEKWLKVTDEYRLPLKNEYIYDPQDGYVSQAAITFTQKFYICIPCEKPKPLYRRCLNWFKSLKG